MITEQLLTGKQIKFKHSEYQFTITATLRLENNEIVIDKVKIGLPVKASKGEKLLLKFAQIYCYDVLCNNLQESIVASLPYQKILLSYNTERANEHCGARNTGRLDLSTQRQRASVGR